MATVSSMSYSNEIQFYEAIVKAKNAQATRDAALKEAENSQVSASFQTVLSESITEYSFDNTQTSSDATALDAYFQSAADTYGISVDLLKAVAKQESNFVTDIVSSAGAIGVMQLMPSTAEYLGVSDPYDAEQNIMGGAKLLAELLDRYDGDVSLALAAYNAGSGAVDAYGGIPPYTETQNFVSKIMTSLGLS